MGVIDGVELVEKAFLATWTASQAPLTVSRRAEVAERLSDAGGRMRRRTAPRGRVGRRRVQVNQRKERLWAPASPGRGGEGEVESNSPSSSCHDLPLAGHAQIAQSDA